MPPLITRTSNHAQGYRNLRGTQAPASRSGEPRAGMAIPWPPKPRQRRGPPWPRGHKRASPCPPRNGNNGATTGRRQHVAVVARCRPSVQIPEHETVRRRRSDARVATVPWTSVATQLLRTHHPRRRRIERPPRVHPYQPRPMDRRARITAVPRDRPQCPRRGGPPWPPMHGKDGATVVASPDHPQRPPVRRDRPQCPRMSRSPATRP